MKNPSTHLRFLLRIAVCLFFLLSGASLASQNFAVTSIVQVPRFSTQLEDYDNAGNVIITLLSTDTRPEYDVILRVNLSGPGYSLRTREDYMSFPITLRRNIPTVLTGAQLRDYFDPTNLALGGLPLSTLLGEGGGLPEGPISLCVDVYDVNRFFDPPVSNTACANGLVLQHRPPYLLEPTGVVAAAFPQQLRFQWQAQHAGFPARYTLQVFEHNLPGMADNLVIENTQPLLEKTLDMPFFLLTNAEQLLLTGQRYLVRVQAKDITQQNTFLNNGWSDVTSFVLREERSTGNENNNELSAADCSSISTTTTLYLADLDAQHALLAWDMSEQEETIPTRLRIKPTVAPLWDSLVVGNPTYFATESMGLNSGTVAEALDLNSNVNYVAQLSRLCEDGNWSDWSEPLTFNLNCAVNDQLWVQGLTDTAADVIGVAYANAAYYSFEYRVLGADDWLVMDELASPLLELVNLSPETTYEVRYRYRCQRGPWSDYSVIIQFSTWPSCSSPTELAMEVLAIDAAEINWRPYVGAEGTALRYRSTTPSYYGYGNNPWQWMDGSEDHQLLKNLQAGARYEYQLRSNCGALHSEWTALEEINLPCAPPQQFEVTDITYESAIVRATGMLPTVQSLAIEYRLQGTEEWQLSTATFGIGALSNLADWSTYEVRLRANCVSGESSVYSDTIQFTTLIKCLTPRGLAASELEPFAAQIDWEETGTITEWEVLLYPRIDTMTQSTSAALNPLANLSTTGRDVSTTPTNDNFTAPTGLNDDRNAGTTTNPAVTLPRDREASDAPFAGWQRFTVTDPTKLLEQLAGNTNYKLVVRANCPQFGWTDYSDTLQFQTLTDCVPAELVALSEVYETSVRVDWQPRVNPNYSVAHRVLIESLYPEPPHEHINTIESTPAGGNSFGGPTVAWQQQMLANGLADEIYRDSIETTNTRYTFQGLYPDTWYRIAVRSRCDNFGWTEATEWIVFRTDLCAAPTNLSLETIDRSTVQLTWNTSNGINDYEVRYRLAGNAGADWIREMTTDSVYLIENLLSNSEYEYQVGEVCQDGLKQRSSPLDSFRMLRPSINNGFYECGIEAQVDLSNEVPLAQLLPGDTIIAFDFPIEITLASGGNGVFSGQGNFRIPYFNQAKVSFAFENILVNEEYRMVAGAMTATGFGVEVLPPWADSLLSDVMVILEEYGEMLDAEQLAALEGLIALAETGQLPEDFQAQAQAVIDCFQNATTPEEEAACAGLLQGLLQDLDGYFRELYNGQAQVHFFASPDQSYGFDMPSPSEPSEWYEQKTISGEAYTLAYKSVQAGYPDQVMAVVAEPLTLDSIYFQQRTATPIPFEGADSTAILTFTGETGDAYYLSALHDNNNPELVDHVVGQLQMIPYDELPLDVVLVPLTASAAAGIDVLYLEVELRRIYQQAVVQPSVQLAPVFSPSGYEPPLQAVSSGLLSNYTAQMRTLINAYKDSDDYDISKHYIFLVDEYEATARAGFNPRGRQFGFLYMGNAGNGNALARTLAHEIGHGAYVLQHTFDEDPEYNLPEGQTDNLMDYADGTRLYKWQWDLVHDPAGGPILEGDAAGESSDYVHFAEYEQGNCTDISIIQGIETYVSTNNELTISWNTDESVERYELWIADLNNSPIIFFDFNDLIMENSVGKKTATITKNNNGYVSSNIENTDDYLVINDEYLTEYLYKIKAYCNETDYAKIELTTGGFEGKNATICEGQTARLGIAEWQDARLFTAVNEERYNYSWSSPQSCPHLEGATSNANPSDNCLYLATRTQVHPLGDEFGAITDKGEAEVYVRKRAQMDFDVFNEICGCNIVAQDATDLCRQALEWETLHVIREESSNEGANIFAVKGTGIRDWQEHDPVWYMSEDALGEVLSEGNLGTLLDYTGQGVVEKRYNSELMRDDYFAIRNTYNEPVAISLPLNEHWSFPYYDFSEFSENSATPTRTYSLKSFYDRAEEFERVKQSVGVKMYEPYELEDEDFRLLIANNFSDNCYYGGLFSSNDVEDFLSSLEAIIGTVEYLDKLRELVSEYPWARPIVERLEAFECRIPRWLKKVLGALSKLTPEGEVSGNCSIGGERYSIMREKECEPTLEFNDESSVRFYAGGRELGDIDYLGQETGFISEKYSWPVLEIPWFLESWLEQDISEGAIIVPEAELRIKYDVNLGFKNEAYFCSDLVGQSQGEGALLIGVYLFNISIHSDRLAEIVEEIRPNYPGIERLVSEDEGMLNIRIKFEFSLPFSFLVQTDRFEGTYSGTDDKNLLLESEEDFERLAGKSFRPRIAYILKGVKFKIRAAIGANNALKDVHLEEFNVLKGLPLIELFEPLPYRFLNPKFNFNETHFGIQE